MPERRLPPGPQLPAVHRRPSVRGRQGVPAGDLCRGLRDPEPLRGWRPLLQSALRPRPVRREQLRRLRPHLPGRLRLLLRRLRQPYDPLPLRLLRKRLHRWARLQRWALRMESDICGHPRARDIRCGTPTVGLNPMAANACCVQDAYCLGKTKRGDPRHPLYLPNDAEMVKWTSPGY